MKDHEAGISDGFNTRLYQDVIRVMKGSDKVTGAGGQYGPKTFLFEHMVQTHFLPVVDTCRLYVFEIRNVVDMTIEVHFTPIDSQVQFEGVICHACGNLFKFTNK
jgi:hypothetical protein